MRSFRVSSNSDINIANALKLPLLLEASSNKGQSSRWPLKPIPWQSQYSVAWSIEAMFIFYFNWQLFIFSLESLWHSSTEWFFKSSFLSFQLQYGWVMRILALDPRCADVGNKTYARQNNLFVDFEYEKKLKLSSNSYKQYLLVSPDFFRLSSNILSRNLNDFSRALFWLMNFYNRHLF